MANDLTIKPNLFLRLLEEAEGVRVLRTFSGAWRGIFKTLAACYSLLLIYSVTTNQWSSSQLRGLFIMFVTCMIFMRYPATRKSPLHRPSAVDFGLIALSVLAFGNFVLDYQQMALRAGDATTRDIIFGVIAIGLCWKDAAAR